MAWKIELGCTVRDRISGFKGLVTGRAEFLTGCNRVQVAPRELDKDGKVQDDRWFDEQTVEVLAGEGMFAVENEKPGGGKNPTRRADAVR